MAKVVAQLAPGIDERRFGEIGDCKRPDCAFGAGVFLVAIGNAQFALVADRCPNGRKIGDGRWRRAVVRDEERRLD